MNGNENEAAGQRVLEEQLRRDERELHRHYSQMGKSLLEMAENEQRAINRLVDDIVLTRAKLAQIKGQRECPACTARNDPDSRYCKRCGQRLEDELQTKEAL